MLGPALGGLATLAFAALRRSMLKSLRVKLAIAGALSLLYGLTFFSTPWWLHWLSSGTSSFTTHG